ncbi:MULTISPECIES: hypothetical protein [unclassified Streptomyces]|uniref:hypothetical protein n=1 Tax=unclassified Streptomyces TaxID=2593676 RepID=UPI000805880F|nr:MULTISPECIES: hypothetical protein [unclassified Streptomyces]MYR75202.1 hypothetical protein [Streptomyces sp. SID4925]SBU98176.1 hypothetical protein YUMDRAFT_06082 [Streptomyces sp. OspMP-M45]
MSPDDLHALQLLAELRRLTNPDQPTAIRLIALTGDGDYIGDVTLPTPGLEHTTQAVSAVADYATRAPENFAPNQGADGLDPLLIAQLEDHCISLDPDYLMAMAVINPDQAVAAFDQITDDGSGGAL